MKLKLAGTNKTKESITDKDIIENLNDKKECYVYLDESNADKDIVKLKSVLEDKDYSVHLREAQINMDENYVYELHIIK
ncbi:MAG: Unknown protein [uncultured Campylobacterales bacterium]|uniref:HP0268 domain-containing protein n=1 Tax=uncultured Campylobacterales bacterium TaxID=352960 RepID=A0A6S6RYZ9_9BACT|nr:MAG: Unknown protein [uncultured Campylobacterales bacterium]